MNAKKCIKNRMVVGLSIFLFSLNAMAEWGGQCAKYAKNRASTFVNNYNSTMTPALGVHPSYNSDLGARWIYDDWDFGYGKGSLPRKNSLMVLEAIDSGIVCYNSNTGVGNGKGCGHVGVVTGYSSNTDGTYNLVVDESNWFNDEQISYGVSYKYNPTANTVIRGSGTLKYNIRGFVYMESATYEFHGAGSLISPEKNCYGCNADLDALHADGQAGLVLFQWYHTPDRCDHIDISVSNMSYALPVKIRSGSWDSRINDKHFVAKLPTSIYASGGSSPWNVTAITFDPLTMPGIVTAKCSVSSKVGTPFSYAPVATETQGIALANGWTWQGNGSLISSLAPGASGYGVTQDVVNLTSEKGAAFFQWQKTFYCKNLQISAKIAGNYKLRLRGWNASPDNRVMTRDMSLSSFATDVLDAGEVSGSTDGYYLLSVYPDISVNMSTVNPINVSCKSY